MGVAHYTFLFLLLSANETAVFSKNVCYVLSTICHLPGTKLQVVPKTTLQL